MIQTPSSVEKRVRIYLQQLGIIYLPDKIGDNFQFPLSKKKLNA